VTDAVHRDDRADICDTLYSFAAGIDFRDWALYRSVFTDEIDVDYSSYRAGSVARMKADDWVARARSLFPVFDATQHSLANPRIRVAGDTAEARTYVRSDHLLRNDEGSSRFTIGGHYVHRLVRDGATWRICAVTLTVTWNEGNRHVLALAADRAAANTGAST